MLPRSGVQTQTLGLELDLRRRLVKKGFARDDLAIYAAIHASTNTRVHVCEYSARHSGDAHAKEDGAPLTKDP